MGRIPPVPETVEVGLDEEVFRLYLLRNRDLLLFRLPNEVL